MSSAWSHGGASVWRLNGAHTRRIRTHRRRTSASSAATTLGSFHKGTNKNKKGNVENFYNNINMEDIEHVWPGPPAWQLVEMAYFHGLILCFTHVNISTSIWLFFNMQVRLYFCEMAYVKLWVPTKTVILCTFSREGLVRNSTGE